MRICWDFSRAALFAGESCEQGQRKEEEEEEEEEKKKKKEEEEEGVRGKSYNHHTDGGDK